jgi:hypothetical protein
MHRLCAQRDILADLHTRTLFGGPSQPEPLDERGGIYRARVLAEEDPSVLNANQYGNDAVSSIQLPSWSYCLTRTELAIACEMDGTADL